MENAPIRITEPPKARDLDRIFTHIFDNAMGNIVILQKSPTKAEMKANTIGYYNNEIFFKLATGELKKVSVTNVT